MASSVDPSSRDDGGPHTRSSSSSREEDLQRAMMEHLQKYSIRLNYPAQVIRSNDNDENASKNDTKSLWTRNDFVQQRLMDSGVFPATTGSSSSLLSSSLSLAEVSNRLGDFVQGMEATGCYDSVKVLLDKSNKASTVDSNTSQQELTVLLGEKRWYKVYVGGGIKGDPLRGGAAGSDLANTKFQLESSIGLRNLSGTCDTTEVSYAVDQTSTPSFHITHQWPFLAVPPPPSTTAAAVGQRLFQWRQGQPWQAHIKASIDTIDHLHTRSCRERQSAIQCQVASAPSSETEDDYHAVTWMAALRDVMPRRHSTIPYQCDASSDVLKHAGPSLKHSLLYQHQIRRHLSFHDNDNDNDDDSLSLLEGKWNLELAGPPGNTGFFKSWGGFHLDVPILQRIWQGLTLHASWQGGFLKPLSFGNLCNTNTAATTSSHITDRFFVGGPNQLRGFMEAGIGPRAKTGGASVPGGDALGANWYYASTIATSIPVHASGIRMFSFLNMGNLTNRPTSLLSTTRLAIGAGLYANLPHHGARMEATYAIPIRYGPNDARRRLQAGIGFSLG